MCVADYGVVGGAQMQRLTTEEGEDLDVAVSDLLVGLDLGNGNLESIVGATLSLNRWHAEFGYDAVKRAIEGHDSTVFAYVDTALAILQAVKEQA
jgi:hypothetical protein